MAAVILVTLLSLAVLVSATSSIPASIEVPREQCPGCKLQQTVHAKGYQYYKFNGTAWEAAFNATARLYDSESKRLVGHHFFLAEADAHGGQPTWESNSKKSGHHHSRVTCKSVFKVDMDRDSIPWVLLKSTHSEGDKAYFGGVTFVQRINTKWGLAPKSTKRARVGEVKRSPYTSDYLFYVSEPKH